MTRRWGRDPFRTGLVRAVKGAARQAMATSTTPGLAVALVHHGQAVWLAGYGVADRTTGEPVTAATRFQAASLSKPVTAWGVLRLVERGRIGLDEPVVGRLPRWRLPPSPFDADGVTVRRLLSHTAGLSVHGYVGQNPDRPRSSIAASLAGETGDGFPVELLEAPGRRWLYSGGGYSVAQLLVEELTGSTRSPHPAAPQRRGRCAGGGRPRPGRIDLDSVLRKAGCSCCGAAARNDVGTMTAYPAAPSG